MTTEYERCWAKRVSPCGEGISREHYFSRGIFPGENVTVLGTSPLPESQREIHIDNLVAKVLCRKHNTELSPLDQALIDLVNSMREIERLRSVRAPIAREWPMVRLTLDGIRLERCILKMVMNHAVVQRKALDGWQPPEWLPEVVYGQKSLARGCGLALVLRLGDTMEDAERVGFVFGQSLRSGQYESVVFEVRHGWKLLCSWEKPIEEIGELRFEGGTYMSDVDTLFHPRALDFKDVRVSLAFDWTGRWSASKYPVVANLRSRFRAPARR